MRWVVRKGWFEVGDSKIVGDMMVLWGMGRCDRMEELYHLYSIGGGVGSGNRLSDTIILPYSLCYVGKGCSEPLDLLDNESCTPVHKGIEGSCNIYGEKKLRKDLRGQ